MSDEHRTPAAVDREGDVAPVEAADERPDAGAVPDAGEPVAEPAPEPGVASEPAHGDELRDEALGATPVQPGEEGEPPVAEPAPAPGEASEPAHGDELRDEALGATSVHTGDEAPAVGPKILGVAPEEKPLPVVKKKLDLRPPKPPREPLPWPELRDAVAAVRDDADVTVLKDLFRLLPTDVRDEVVTGVREFRKGARRPLSAFAAKSLARAVHTNRRMRRNAEPSGAVSEALGLAMIAELIASLEVERAAEVILPKRDLLEREARQARRKARDEEDRRKEEHRRKRREDAKGARGQTSFGKYSGAKIKGIEQLAGLFGDEQREAPPADAEPEAPEEAAVEAPRVEAPAAEEPAAEAPATEEPAAEAPATEEPAAEAPATEEAPAEDVATEEEPAAEAPATEEAPAEDVATEEEPAAEDVAPEPPADEPPAGDEPR